MLASIKQQCQGKIMSRITRRAVVAGAVLAPFVARAQTWPSGPIRLIVPYPAGGSVDTLARLAQAGLQQRLGATIIVENRSGASGSTGSLTVAKSPPDGNTWLVVFDNHGVNPALLPNYPFDNEKDLEPVTLVGTAPYMVATSPSKPYKSLADVVAAAKKAPGKVSYGSVGSGSIGHLAMVLLGKQAGIDLTHVPYRGGAPAVNDALAGHIDLVNGSAALITPHVAAGRLRPVWQHGAKRLPAHPNLPTVGEGGFPAAEANAWWGVYAPAKTPKQIIDRFRTALIEALREEKPSKVLTESQQMTLVLSTPQELRQFEQEQARIWSAVIHDNGIKGD
jgi:tripartite-type tricarboxylate transporter receptor subunit TctC